MYALFAAGDMKRDAYGEDGPVHKRQRQTDDEVTFLIPSKVIVLANPLYVFLVKKYLYIFL